MSIIELELLNKCKLDLYFKNLLNIFDINILLPTHNYKQSVQARKNEMIVLTG